MDYLKFWKDKLDQVNREIGKTLFLETERLYYLNARKGLFELMFNKTLMEVNRK